MAQCKTSAFMRVSFAKIPTVLTRVSYRIAHTVSLGDRYRHRYRVGVLINQEITSTL